MAVHGLRPNARSTHRKIMISYNMIIVQALRTGWNPHAPNPHKALNRKIIEAMKSKILVVVLP